MPCRSVLLARFETSRAHRESLSSEAARLKIEADTAAANGVDDEQVVRGFFFKKKPK